ncbi:MAG: carbamoyltransferase [Chitinophagaceae bacterium]|nr:carbamoyltransferase [Chitinophagaceae bacterium]MCZ2397334.1 carbamoyltransferase [Chitinophagales bacterium]
MKIIGINAWHADASAALIIDGKVIVAIEEERFTRVKHWAGFPAKAIEFCLKEAGLTYNDINFFVIGRDPGAKFLHKLLYLAKHPAGSWNALKSRLQNSRKVQNLSSVLAKLSGLSENRFSGKVVHVEHHRSHLASAFYTSPFKESACLSVDGSGDFSTTMMGYASNNRIEVTGSINFPHSLGLFYTAFTQLLGFPNYGDEYKVMGMAPYGRPVFKEEVARLVHLTSDGAFRLNLKYFRKGTEGIISYDEQHIPRVQPLYSAKLEREFGPLRSANDPLLQSHKDMAASVQAVTEDVIFHMLRHLHKKTGSENVCIAGGVAQNSVANGKIRANTPFKNVYIPSAGHDAGISMGAALHHYFRLNPASPTFPTRHAYLGSRFTNEEIKTFLNDKGFFYEELADEELFNTVTDQLINGGVVGWFCGRSEFGPRALGGRSILADPRRHDAKKILNEKIKRRENFRPFAPSILKEYANEFFENAEDVPFMEKVLVIRPDKRNLIPAVTHIDGTGRLQTVDKDCTPRYYNLIDAFRRKTGIPILLNTSFNENEPIVNAPEEALNCFLRTKMDMLVMENCVLSRKKLEAWLSKKENALTALGIC